MIVVINDGGKLSLKADFVLNHFRATPNELFYVYKKQRFTEAQGANYVELANSASSIIAYYALMFIKSPKDIRDGIMKRVFQKQKQRVLFEEGFFSTLSKTLQQYVTKPRRQEGTMLLLKQMKTPQVFIIDEFWSVNILNLKALKKLGPIIYVSQDLAHNSLSFGENYVAQKLIYKLEKDAVAFADLVIACSERDRLKYIEMGAKEAVFYPNIYPVQEFQPQAKDEEPSIALVLRGHWGPRVHKSLNQIFSALSLIDKKLKVYLIGIEPKNVPSNIDLVFYKTIPSKTQYLEILSKSWIGINIGVHKGGTNQRKYDYAFAGTVVISDQLGTRGDLLPCEYTYIDNHDLAAKINQLLMFGREELAAMGKKNRRQTLILAQMQNDLISKRLQEIIGP